MIFKLHLLKVDSAFLWHVRRST